jgi:hypothetical protein
MERRPSVKEAIAMVEYAPREIDPYTCAMLLSVS